MKLGIEYMTAGDIVIAWLGARFPAHLLNKYSWLRLLDLVLEHLYKFQWIEDIYFGGLSDDIYACRELVISH